jgi:DNA-binding MarR family transcriptional regulator
MMFEMAVAVTSLTESELLAWRSFLGSHASILRALDADLVAEHRITARDYEVMLYLAQAPDRKLPMSALAEGTMLTRSGITRLVDGLVGGGLVRRVSCEEDARVSYARLTDPGHERLIAAGRTHVAGIRHQFLEHFSPSETELLGALLARLPGAPLAEACAVVEGAGP